MKFQQKNICKIERDKNFSFSKYTTFGVGGGCKNFYLPKTFTETKFIFDFLRDKGKVFVLGNGSNVLASDKEFSGGVICTKALSGIFRVDEKTIFCKSGTSVSKLLFYCKNQGLSGLEYLAGIPATVGGLTLMNGGAGGKFLAENVKNVVIYDKKQCTMSDIECNFSYKYSTMRDIICVILGTYLDIFPSDPQSVTNSIDFYLQKRKNQPKGRSCGCVFKNVQGISAGKIIEDCGLKGARCGNAHISEKHANFIINEGNSAQDIYRLIIFIKDTVLSRFNIKLEEEVVYLGDFL